MYRGFYFISVAVVGLVAGLLIPAPPDNKPVVAPVVMESPVPMDRMYPDPHHEVKNPVAEYEGTPEEDELKDVQVPVPMKDRVFNRTGIQCVWCSIELMGRWAEEPKLIGPPCMTDWKDCKSYSGPASAGRKLNQIKVKFEQVTNKQAGRALLRKAVAEERRGALFAVPGHAMNIVHYDEAKKVVKYINNSDKSLKIRTWTMDEFEKRWEGWVLVIYADKDIIPQKFAPPAVFLLPIIDRNNPQGQYDPKMYIPFPGKR